MFSAGFLGGSELFNLEFLRDAHDHGVAVHAVVPGEGDLADALAPLVQTLQVVPPPGALTSISRFDPRVGVAALPSRSGAAARYLRDLRAALTATPGLLCALGFRSQLSLGIAAAGLRRPVAWVVHEVVPSGPYGALWSAFSRRARCAFGYSAVALGQPYLRTRDRRLRRVRLPLGAFAGLADPRHPPSVVALVGDLVPLKNHLALVDVVERLRLRDHDVKGVLVGRDLSATNPATRDYAEAVRARVQRSGVVRMLAVHPDEMPEVLEGVDVLLHLSNVPETFGRVCAEAMAAGRPVVAFDHGAVSEVVRGGGVLCPPGDLTAVTDAVELLRADEDGFRRLSRSARATAAERFGDASREPTIGDGLADLAQATAAG